MQLAKKVYDNHCFDSHTISFQLSWTTSRYMTGKIIGSESGHMYIFNLLAQTIFQQKGLEKELNS